MTGTVNPPPGPFVERLPRGERSPADFEWVRPTGDPDDARILADWVAYFLATTATLQPLDDTLTALAGVTTEADKLIYATGADSFATADLTSAARGLLSDATAEAMRARLAIREKLSANRTYYVRTDGSDSNDGLSNSAGGAFLTIQKAIDTVYGLDFSIYNVTISVQSGTYTAGGTFNGRHVGTGLLTITGNGAVTISTTNLNALSGTNGAQVIINGFTITTTTAGSCIVATDGASLTIGANMVFGACASFHINIDAAKVKITAAYTISGGAVRHFLLSGLASLSMSSFTVTVSGTPAFTTFITAQLGSVANIFSVTFSGSATGARYGISLNSAVQTYGGGASFFPGDSAGSTATGGQYA